MQDPLLLSLVKVLVAEQILFEAINHSTVCFDLARKCAKKVKFFEKVIGYKQLQINVKWWLVSAEHRKCAILFIV